MAAEEGRCATHSPLRSTFSSPTKGDAHPDDKTRCAESGGNQHSSAHWCLPVKDGGLVDGGVGKGDVVAAAVKDNGAQRDDEAGQAKFLSLHALLNGGAGHPEIDHECTVLRARQSCVMQGATVDDFRLTS